jgi:hypothetical protein
MTSHQCRQQSSIPAPCRSSNRPRCQAHTYMRTKLLSMLAKQFKPPPDARHTHIYYTYTTTICVLILLYICSHTTIYVSSYYYMCPHARIYVSSYKAHMLTAALMSRFSYIHRYSPIYVSSYYSIRDGRHALSPQAPRGALLYVSSY